MIQTGMMCFPAPRYSSILIHVAPICNEKAIPCNPHIFTFQGDEGARREVILQTNFGNVPAPFSLKLKTWKARLLLTFSWQRNSIASIRHP